MNKYKIPHLILVVIFVLGPSASATLMAQTATESQSGQKGVIRGIPILWEDPGRIEDLDLFYGSGGQDGVPDTSESFKFISELTGGASKKYLVQDKQGRKWVVKIGDEAKPETVATRFVWAMGYHTDITYFVKRAHIVGDKELVVENVRFERRPDGYQEVSTWSWDENPFREKREMEGLKILMVLLNNWDIKKSNNSIICQGKAADVSQSKCFYYVSDLGATLGATGSITRKLLRPFDPPAGSRGEADDYAEQNFIKGVRDGKLFFNYKGKDADALKGVSVESAAWLGEMLGRLSEKQISDAFRAGGYEGAEHTEYVQALRWRIGQLQQAAKNQISAENKK